MLSTLMGNMVFADSEKEKSKEPEQLHAYSALLMDKHSGRVLWDKKGYEERSMASTTKIMTCIIALESCKMDEIVKVSEKASRAPKVKMYIRPDEEYYLGDLLHALMLISSNDVAIAIAEHISGTTEDFCNKMTQKARALGAINTSYKTPNGLDAEGHYTTAYDLALITRYAMENEAFVKLVNTPSIAFNEITSNRPFNITNKDAFLNMYEGANGVKTGFTSKAGYCFVGSAKRGDMELISVVLASGWPNNRTYRWADTKKIMDYGFGNFKTKSVLSSGQHVSQLPVDQGIGKDIDVYTTEDIDICLGADEEVTILYNVEPHLIAPVEIGQHVGSAEIYVDGQLYASSPLITNTAIEKIDFTYTFHKVLNAFVLFSNDEQ
ncbi:D-alanyl-D-alanine carboxypeptidase [Vallitalea pronyensis]|uniref:serine-type D-Ala-D-Ala carboxypeptidase n=1 Tax=Vallitalea pronyensis TaxID=1348613 RepID=A0A8J8MKQ5_9FIRM|nr:D-alanyl-D-alanine carboxypeptidase family protein [Vallitalea pronyensis]QUI23088.1 D-alanyl-D-alanine carboxypeptidase [Vallitalea pronyensis]